MSTTLIIALIIVVWLVVLAPLIFRGHKPIRHSGEGFNDTRVVFSGGKDVLKTPMRPRMAGARSVSGIDTEPAADYELVDAEEYEIIDEPWNKRASAAETHVGDNTTSSNETGFDSVDGFGDSNTNEAEVIDGELVADQGESFSSSDDVIDGELVADQVHGSANAKELGAEFGVGERIDNESGAAADVASESVEDEAEPQPRVIISELSPDEMYSHDETYTSPVDLLYPGVVDADSIITKSAVEESAETAASESESAETNPAEMNPTEGAEAETDGAAMADDVVSGGSDAEGAYSVASARADREAELTLTEEELAFAARRSQRGGWNPKAERKLQAQRTKRRRNNLVLLLGALAVLLIVAIPTGGWFWALPAVTGLLTLLYLLALRGQVQQEQELRARRIRQLRRARMGVRNREDDEHRLDEHRPFVNPNLRRPGAVVLEIDDESPDFDELRTIDHQQLNDDRGDYASRTLYRQQQASRAPALRSVARDGSLNAGRTVRTRGRRVV
ncbi:divisome protein SepX/GlpR [Corynebacterium pseudodiphtheriticum]|uniref:divisome protein SepX/GlpR n=1 Tax=Corynebacterium pseudodiphtheriticum TaxID=37637 RepID=UPI00254E2558|nr:gephyrin-like molybdotransferase receptor GlpR [Corynebacterium pseudodiphtheriticum]MDK8685648.1 hypothetical protein [Corynebacterium pseudodiphtheriticum]